jgi:hypothetical protein
MDFGRRRILFVGPSWPCGDAYGGRLRALHTVRALKMVGEVTLAVVTSEKDSEAEMRMSAVEFKVIRTAPPKWQTGHIAPSWRSGHGTPLRHGWAAAEDCLRRSAGRSSAIWSHPLPAATIEIASTTPWQSAEQEFAD